MFLCVSTTPLGTPVEPLVYMMMAVSSGEGGTSAATEGTNYSNSQDTTLIVTKYSKHEITEWLIKNHKLHDHP
jgi:hypothetical protein